MTINVDEMRTNAGRFDLVREALSERVIDFGNLAAGEINQLSGRITTDTIGRRFGVTLALVATEHADTIGQCTRVGNYASALAVWRPMFEALIKLVKIDSIHDESEDRIMKLVCSQPGVDKGGLEEFRRAGGPDILGMWMSIREWANDMCHGGIGQLSANRISGGFEANYPGQWVWMAARTAGPAASFGYGYIARLAGADELRRQMVLRTRAMFTGRLHAMWNGMNVEMYSQAEEVNIREAGIRPQPSSGRRSNSVG